MATHPAAGTRCRHRPAQLRSGPHAPPACRLAAPRAPAAGGGVRAPFHWPRTRTHTCSSDAALGCWRLEGLCRHRRRFTQPPLQARRLPCLLASRLDSPDGGADGDAAPVSSPSAAAAPLRRRGSLSLFLSALACFRSTWQPLAVLALCASLAERLLTNGVYALCAALGVPVASPATLLCGCAGIAASFLVHAYAKGASFVLLHTTAGWAASPPGGALAWGAWARAVRHQAPGPLLLLVCDVKRLAAVAWSYAITFPVPLFALPRAVELAFAVPVAVLDTEHRAQPLKHSTALVQRRRLTTLHALSLMAAFLGAAACLGASATLALAPSLPDVLLQGAASSAPGDLAAHFFSGAAFAGVFQTGTTAEQGALTTGLVLVAALRWATNGLLNALLTVMWMDFHAVGPLPPREAHPLVKAAAAWWEATTRRLLQRLPRWQAK